MIDVEERDLCPVVGEQQRHHRLRDLRVGRTSACEGREILFVRRLVIGAEVRNHRQIEGRRHSSLVVACLLRSDVAINLLLPQRCGLPDARDLLAIRLRHDEVDAMIKSRKLLLVDFFLRERQSAGDCQACQLVE